MNSVRFAIIGCGRIAYRHIEAIRGNPNAQLVALCDLNLDRAHQQNRGVGAAVYQDYRRMLSREKIDVVCIMTPSGMHAEHAREIIGSFGKHVVVEKPVCLSVRQGEELIAEARHSGVRLFAVHQNRLNKAMVKLHALTRQADVGRISLATVRLRWSRDQAYYDRDPWRGLWALDGGVLTNQAIHHIDLLRWLVGEVESVSAIGTTRLVKVEVEDTACAWLRFANGAIGVIEATNTVRPKDHDLEASISILTERGTYVVEGTAANRFVTASAGDVDVASYVEQPPNVYGFGHDDIIANVVEVLQHGGEPLITGEDALQSVRLLSAIYCSMERGGREVRLADCPVSERLGIITPSAEPIADLYRTARVLGERP